MKLIAAAFFSIAVCFVASAQDAKVIALNSADAAEIKSYYDQIDALNKKIAAKKAEIDDKYTMEVHVYPATACVSDLTVTHADGTKTNFGPHGCTPPKPTPEEEKASHVRQHKFGWQYGFKFSDDFKFIVPLPTPTYNGWNNGCITLGTQNTRYAILGSSRHLN